MASLFDTIMGNSDPNATPTPDPAGLSAGDRSQIGFGGIGQLGALLMAAGQPMYGADRARYLAQMGQVPAQMQQAKTQAIQQKRLGQQYQNEQAQAEATKQVRAGADTADMSGLTPAQQQLMKAAYLSGDPSKVLAVQKDIRETQQPLPLGGGMFAYRNADGSYTAVNPVTQVRMPLNGQMQPTGSATYANGAPVEEGDTDINPDTGFRDKWLAKQGRDASYIARLQKIARGDEGYPTARDPARYQILTDLAQYAPGTGESDYNAKKNFQNSVTSGKLYQGTVLPAQRFLNHAAMLADNYDKLGLDDNFIGVNGGNQVKMYGMERSGGDSAAKLKAAEEALNVVKKEGTKFLRGTGQLTDQSEREVNDLTLSNPGKLRGWLQTMTEAMHGQVDPVLTDYQRAMKRPRANLDDLLGKGAGSNMLKAQAWAAGKGGGAPTEAPAAPPAPAQQGGNQPALPPDADTSKYDYRFDAARGTWQRRAK